MSTEQPDCRCSDDEKYVEKAFQINVQLFLKFDMFYNLHLRECGQQISIFFLMWPHYSFEFETPGLASTTKKEH